MKRFLAALLSAIIVLSISTTAFAAYTNKSPFTSNTYTHNSKYTSHKLTHGIDVSYHNGDINWKKVKSGGVDFVIMRVGYRGYLADGKICADKKFSEYIEQAIKYDFPIGVYFYSQALNNKEAIAEANFILDNIAKYKKDITLPVVFDYEFADVSKGRLDSAWREKKINKTTMTNAALAFCETVENAGYKAMVYANKSFLSDNVDHTKIEDKYGIWLAHYTTKTDYSGEYNIWQYSSTGGVSGINGYIDCNFMYESNSFTTSEITDKVYTGEEIKPEFDVFYQDKKLIKGEDYYISFSNNVKIGMASVTITGVGAYEAVDKTKINYNIVPTAVENVAFSGRTDTSVQLEWDAHKDASGYQIWVERGTNNWSLAGTTKETSFNVTKLTSASNYRFRVCAYKTISGSHYYGEFSAPIKSATKPSKVTELTSSSRGENYIKLQWKKQKNASKYLVFQYDFQAKKYVQIKEISGGKNNKCTINNLKPNSKYKFKVRAVKNAKDGAVLKGAASAGKTVYTSPSAPAIKSAKAAKNRKIAVKWKKTKGVSGYQIMWSTTRDFSSNYKSERVGSSYSSHKITAAKSKKKYYVRVRAYKTRSGKKYYSPWSKTLSVKTK